MKLVPKRRFKGFSREWEERSLRDLADIVGGGTPSTSNPRYWNGEIDWYSPTEIGDRVYADTSMRKITQLGLESSSAHILPANKTILFTSRAGIGDMAILRRPGATNQGFQSLVLKDRMDSYFVYSMGHLIKKQAIKNASGSTFLEISGKELGKIELRVPPKVEQQEIGNFFRLIDEKLDIEMQSLNKLKTVKQAYLHEMFPAEGESVPKRRFAGFIEDWETKRLSEILQVNSGRDYKHLQKGDIPVYGTGGYILSVDDNLSEVDGIGIGRKGTIDKPLYLKAPFWTVDTLFFLTPILNCDLYYFYLMCQKVDWRAMDESTGVPSLSKNTIESIPLRVAKLEEQQKIGSFFRKLDERIAMQEAKVMKLKATKKAYLEEMFV